MSNQPKKYRSFTGILYPDSESYSCSDLLEFIPAVFDDWAYILHDRDLNALGEVKKAHYHWVGRRKNPVAVKTVANLMGLRETEVEYAKRGWQPVVRYLIHIDDDDKYQYSQDDVVANFDYGRFLVDKVSSEVMAKGIYQYIIEFSCCSVIQLLGWCQDNGYWTEFRRSYPVWEAVMREIKTKEMYRES